MTQIARPAVGADRLIGMEQVRQNEPVLFDKHCEPAVCAAYWKE